jgi:hypothetical protein
MLGVLNTLRSGDGIKTWDMNLSGHLKPPLDLEEFHAAVVTWVAHDDEPLNVSNLQDESLELVPFSHCVNIVEGFSESFDT